MSQSESPIRAMFDAQRTAIKQSQQLFKQSLAVQRSADKMALSGLKSQETMQRQGLELAQAATHGYLGAATAMMNVDDSLDTYQAVDETFARLKETHAQLFDATERELERGVDSFDDLSEEYVEALDEQTDQLLESHQIVEDQTAENVDEFSQQLREQLEGVQEMQDRLEDQFEHQSEQVEDLLERQNEQAEHFQQRLEEEAEQMQRQFREQVGATQSATTAAKPALEEGEETAHRLEEIDGVDETVRQLLQDSGINTIDDLAKAGADTVAEAADVSEDRAEEWIQQAEA